MKRIRKYNDFLDEKISTAFQTNHSNRLGPGYNWKLTTSWEKSPEMEILPKFIEEYGEATLEKDDEGYYISTSLSTEIPNTYMGIRVIQSYRESLGFEVSDIHSKEEIIFILERYVDILMMGESNQPKAANNANVNPDKMSECLDNIMNNWYESDGNIIIDFFDNFSKKYNHSKYFTTNLLSDINKGVMNWEKNRITDLDAGTLYSNWSSITRSINDLLIRMDSME